MPCASRCGVRGQVSHRVANATVVPIACLSSPSAHDAGESTAHFVPLCAFGPTITHTSWHKLVLPVSTWAPSFHEAFDEIVLLAAADLGEVRAAALPSR